MKNKILKLMEKEGFILFLFICVCVIAGGTLFISMRNLNLAENKQMNKDLVIVESQDNDRLRLNEIDTRERYLIHEGEVEDLRLLAMNEDDPYVKEEILEETEEEVAEVEVDEEAVEVSAIDEVEAEVEEEVELEFVEEEEDLEVIMEIDKGKDWILPIEGSVITEFTRDSLIYSDTLESWVGHKAIDIAAKEGSPVVAAMDGVIKEVYEDELWGIVIVIDHGNNLKTRYANLSTKEMVKPGIDVKKGDHISKVGRTAKIEMLMEPHLHFELMKNEEIIDPRSIND